MFIFLFGGKHRDSKRIDLMLTLINKIVKGCIKTR
jgi:hypothetical protein